MKKNSLFVILLVVCIRLQSQPFTGLNTYQHLVQNLILTDGKITSANSNGFILAGHVPVVVPGGANIYIDKTDVDGMFNGAPAEFSNEYTFSADAILSCGSNINPASNCYGVSVYELPFSGLTQLYAIAAAFDKGCLYADLDMNGNAAPKYYTFPVSANHPTKPVITGSAFNPASFFITGSYQVNGLCYMYIIKVGPNPWSVAYSAASGEFVPSGIVESPYASLASPEIAIVGTFKNNSGLNRQGFFCRVKEMNGAVAAPVITYGSGSSSNESFLSIHIAASTLGAHGYVIGGFSDINPASGTSWMLKVNQAGSVVWSSRVAPSTGAVGKVVGVTERFNSYGTYDYYGTTTDNNGATVLRLNNTGNIFSQPGNTYNEFIYNDNIGGIATPAAISYANNAGSPNEGIHVFSTNNNIPGDYFLVRACFNGAAGNPGCSIANITLNSLAASAVSAGPAVTNTIAINTAAGPVVCTNFIFNVASTPVNLQAPCNEYTMPFTPYPGDQGRPAVATGVKSNTTSEFSISPNPVTDKLTISYGSNAGTNVVVSLYNNLGQLVMPETVQPHNSTTLELDLGKLNINSGVYFVTITVDGVKTTKKIIYTK